MSLIFGGLLLWGLYLSLGVWWKGLNPIGALVVMFCVSLFLGFWWVLLQLRSDRKKPGDSP